MRALAVLYALAALACLRNSAVADYTTLWPQPFVLTNGSVSDAVSLPGEFQFVLSGSPYCIQSSNILSAAFARYTSLVFWHGAPSEHRRSSSSSSSSNHHAAHDDH